MWACRDTGTVNEDVRARGSGAEIEGWREGGRSTERILSLISILFFSMSLSYPPVHVISSLPPLLQITLSHTPPSIRPSIEHRA